MTAARAVEVDDNQGAERQQKITRTANRASIAGIVREKASSERVLTTESEVVQRRKGNRKAMR